jgi:hypothetical protein
MLLNSHFQPMKGFFTMPLQENEFSRLVHLNPTAVRCDCKKSPLVPLFPLIHCPKCHETYTARTDHYPRRCGPCGFNLSRWRRLNSIPER